MRKILSVVLVVGLLAAGCAALGLDGTAGATVTRIIADIGCVTALAAAGVQLAGDPMVSGATTATGVMAAIGAIGASNMPSTVLAACKDTLSYAAEDMKGLTAFVKGTTGSTAAKVTPKAPMTMTTGKPPVPLKPTPVQVVIPGR